MLPSFTLPLRCGETPQASVWISMLPHAFHRLYSATYMYQSIWCGPEKRGRIDEFFNNLLTRFFIIHLKQMLVVSTISINGGSHFPIFPPRRTWSSKQHTTAIVEIGQSQRSFLTGKFVQIGIHGSLVLDVMKHK